MDIILILILFVAAVAAGYYFLVHKKDAGVRGGFGGNREGRDDHPDTLKDAE
jgi:hypothetical protein